MKKDGVINSELARVIAEMGHQDSLLSYDFNGYPELNS